MDFAVLANNRVKIKENIKRDNYLDLAEELRKLWNMRVLVIRIVIGAFRGVTKGLLKGLEVLGIGGLIKTIQGKALWRSVRILRKFLVTFCHSSVQLTLKCKTYKEYNDYDAVSKSPEKQKKKYWISNDCKKFANQLDLTPQEINESPNLSHKSGVSVNWPEKKKKNLLFSEFCWFSGPQCQNQR